MAITRIRAATMLNPSTHEKNDRLCNHCENRRNASKLFTDPINAMRNTNPSIPFEQRIALCHWRPRFAAVFAVACVGLLGAGHAQAYPDKPIRMVLPFPPGGSTDIMARSLAQKLTESLGKQIVVDNRGGGAGGISGTDLVAKAAPDGYVLLLTTSISHTAGASLYSKLPYHPVRDFAPITMTAFAPQMMVVHPSVAAKTVPEFIALAKATPGQINYASGGLGTSTHLPVELFMSMAGVQMVHVPYKGGGPALLGVMGGQSQMLMISLVGALPHVKSGKLRALALTSLKRAPELPDLPTVAESVPGYDVSVWYGIFAPRGTPAPVIHFLHGTIVKILQTRDMRERLAQDGAQPLGNTPAEFAVLNQAEVAKWAKVVREARIKAE